MPYHGHQRTTSPQLQHTLFSVPAFTYAIRHLKCLLLFCLLGSFSLTQVYILLISLLCLCVSTSTWCIGGMQTNICRVTRAGDFTLLHKGLGLVCLRVCRGNNPVTLPEELFDGGFLRPHRNGLHQWPGSSIKHFLPLQPTQAGFQMA